MRRASTYELVPMASRRCLRSRVLGVGTTTAFLAFALAFVAPSARADTTEQNLAKYWRLRQRLVTDFTSVGGEPGQSQPAPERDDVAHAMYWGDGTIALGHYIGVLASELYLLESASAFPGADGGDATHRDKTRDELFYALMALERLDRNADASFPDPCTPTPSLNGFFIRDDVPSDFYVRFPGITQVSSDYTTDVLTNKEMSQDQVYHVQVGLALVVKLVPATVVVHDRPLRAWAMEQAERIARHVVENDWFIRNPACGNRTVARGQYAGGYSGGEVEAIRFLTDGAYAPTTNAFLQSAWDTMRNPENPAYDDDTRHMTLAVMAVGDAFGPETAEIMAPIAAAEDWPLYPLLHRVLHGSGAVGFCTTAPSVNERARVQLDELPADGEPYCPRPGGPAVHGFTTHNRYIRGKSQHYVGAFNCANFRYHGLDYMLLHNLYAIATPGTWKGSPGADPCAPVAPSSETAAPPDVGAAVTETPQSERDDGRPSRASGCAFAASAEGRSRPPIIPALALLLAGALLARRHRA